MSAAALRTDGAGDSTPGSDVGERITRLFPKCRPKNMQHQHDRYRLNSGLEGRDINNVNNVSSDEERNDSQLVILNSKGGTYKLRDSRIIEIAGGRELYSQSRTKAVRKLRHNNTHKHNLRNKVRSLNKDTVDYADNHSNEIPLHRISNEPKKMISRHTSPTYTNGDRDPVIETNTMGIPKNSSPILDPHKTNDVSTKSSPIAVVADGEVVVFDDNDDWKVILNSVSLGLRTEPDASDDEIDMSVKRTLDNIKNGDSDVMNNKSELSCDGGSESTPSREDVRLSDASPSGVWLSGDEDKNRVTRVIGELPIAEYEGSPRRYGIGTQKTTNRSPRPGFPQRVVTESRDVTPPSSSAAFDYLYEFSETRKVLEEFFKCPAVAGQMALNSNDEIVNFQDLDYELRRQTQDCLSENGLEGSDSEWPQVTDTIHSPHTTHNHTNFLGLQQQRSRYPEPNVSELSVGAAWSGSASPGAPRRDRVPFALSSDTSDTGSDLSLMLMENELSEMKGETMQIDSSRVVVTHLPIVEDGLSSGHASDNDNNNQMPSLQTHNTSVIIEEIVENGTNTDPHVLSDADLHSLDPLACGEVPPPPPAPAPHRPADGALPIPHTAPQHLPHSPHSPHAPHSPHSPHAPHSPHVSHSPHHHHAQHITHHDDVYPPRKRPSSAQSAESVEIKQASGDEDEADTDLETDRLLGQQRTDDQGFFDEKGWRKPKSRTVMPAGSGSGSARSPPHAHDAPDGSHARDEDALHNGKDKDGKKKSKNKEVLIEGVLFRARYLGSTQLACEGQPTKATRMLQAEEAVSRIKAPEGENQPSTEVDLFISTEKIMVLNTELKEIMMDHALRTISYIADIGDLVVLMARRRFVPHENDSDQPKLNRTPKMICHVFESEEAQFIAQSIGQAFQVAYMEFLKANGIEDHSFVKEMDYQEVLNSQEIFGDELQMFAKKELQKEVVVPKTKGEILGVVVVESGWGSMLPTVVIANLAPAGAAARCGQLNIGDQIIAINGVSLVGLPLSTCQTYIKNSKNQTVVKLTVVPCAPVVEVKIKRPDTKYQLGFSVQNGVICSLLRGGIAERGGVRVGHRIIEINSQSVVAVPHERIVNLLATSVGEILMKTMPTSMFRLLTGQENPVFI
ncbi:protein lin-10-like isoform X8 [Galleria mellonella]|uniref:Protein lin-10-like isoform X8 n=1 Tax=Galleria mellonella TaxID=7137 RepID=A0ABM3MCU5_GALME|nr:protein lin-10-like isoform X8 [Galleria mellonella]